MGRSHFCPKDEGMNKGAWTAVEDKILKNYIKIHGDRNWRNISKESGLKRCGKSCRLRWLNYLRPDIKRGNISQDEEDLIIRLHKLLGNKWALIAGRLPGRTDNAIKNYWNTHLSKKAQEKKSNQPKNEGEKNIRPPDHEASPESGLIKAEASHKAECNDTKVALAPSMDCSYVKNVASESESSDKNLSEFTMDFIMGEICLTEILKPDNITKVNDFEIHDFNNNVIEGYDGTDNGCKNQHQISPFSDQEVLVYEEMEENWRSSSTDYVQAGMDYSDFGFLASFFEPADDDHEYWLGEDLTINVYPS